MKLLFSEKLIPKNPGIYKLVISGKNYVGSSICLNDRLRDHKTTLKHNKNQSVYLQNAFNKYGMNNLYYEILFEWNKEQPTREEILQKEKEFINLLKPEFNLVLDPTTGNNAITTSKKVYQYSLNGNYLKEFISCNDAKRLLNITGIQHAASEKEKLQKFKTAGGFMWRYYKIDKLPIYENNSDKSKIISVTMYSIIGNKIKTYLSIADCVKENFYTDEFSSVCAIISSICREKMISYKNYRFSYENLDKLDNTKLLKYSKNIPILQIDINTNIVLKVWNKWSDIKKEFQIKHNFSRQLKLQESFYKKTSKINNFKWLSLATASQFGELLEYP